MNEIGKPLYWNLQTHIDAAIGMIRADEVQIALRMLEDVPAWYRENPPKELTEIRRRLYQQLYDQMDYGNDDEEAEMTREIAERQFIDGYMFPRAEIIKKIVTEYNVDRLHTPWIFDLGCSHGNLPMGLLKHTECRFEYFGKSLNNRIANKVKSWCGYVWREVPGEDQAKILVCTEVLEHCMSPMDIVQSAYKMGIDWDKILLSVPLGCLGGGLENWDTRRLGHVRGYTKQEFIDFAPKHWPGYKWTLTIAPSMVLVGERI